MSYHENYQDLRSELCRQDLQPLLVPLQQPIFGLLISNLLKEILSSDWKIEKKIFNIAIYDRD